MPNIRTAIVVSACTMLPNDVRTRTYAATIPPIGNGIPANGNVPVRLTGATFLGDSNVIDMCRAPFSLPFPPF